MRKLSLLAEIWLFLKLIIRPVISGALIASVWATLKINGILAFTETTTEAAGNDANIDTVFMSILLAFSMAIVGITISKAWNQSDKIEEAITRKDEEIFKAFINKKIHFAIHILMGIMAFLTIGYIMVMNHMLVWKGIAAIFSVTFLFHSCLVVAVELDGVDRGYIKMDIPKEWRKHINKTDNENRHLIRRIIKKVLIARFNGQASHSE